MSIPRTKKLFSLFRRNHKGNYFARFKSPVTGKIIKTVSTKKTVYNEAEQVANKWAVLGLPKNGELVSLQFQNFLTAIPHLTDVEKKALAKELIKYNTYAVLIQHNTEEAIDFIEFLENFWNPEKSPFLRQKREENPDSIHTWHISCSKSNITSYWKPFFKGKLLGEITRNDIRGFRDSLSERKSKKGTLLSPSRKQNILQSGAKAVLWAHREGLIPFNPCIGLVNFAKNPKKPEIISPELAAVLFTLEWADERARLANILAMITGMRAGEIRALQVRDLGDSRLYVRHSYNVKDHLKTTKTNQERVVFVFPEIIAMLSNLARLSPHGTSPESYIFWSDLTPGKPAEGKVFMRGLRSALRQTGMSELEIKKYRFHSWRHTWISLMRDRLSTRIIKLQSGHATDSMVTNLYGNHALPEDEMAIRAGQEELFRPMLLLAK